MVKVKTNNGKDAHVEERRQIHVNGRKVTMTLYYTTCSIFLQGSPNKFPETAEKTPAEYFAGELEKVSEELLKQVDVKSIVEKMKKSINNFRAEHSLGVSGRGPRVPEPRGKSTNKSKNTPAIF